ncbi:mitochondrial 39-S ribosomal protein L47 (MRP-L47)-domain-containing protein [Phycomyces nitens]|nr:mitochondrial 39-S ribosomal protein L47 (MRP-L47)-domain-containing protein [Phycomyces nitens]
MSFLHRITRSVSLAPLTRSFTTSRIVLAESSAVPATPTPKTTGIYEFFENGETLPKQGWTGRAWKADELRAKSFDDLHKLWYVLLKERNVLATQREQAKRLSIGKQIWTNSGRMKKCQKSMARIKFVLNERQIAYEKLVSEAKEKTPIVQETVSVVEETVVSAEKQ